MIDEPIDPGSPEGDEGGKPSAVLATTEDPVSIDVHQIEDERVPDGMECLGTYLEGSLVARCAVPDGATEFFNRHGLFSEPRQLVLTAREENPGLRCELYALVPVPLAELMREEDDEEAEPWSASVPSSNYEQAAAELAAQDGADGESGPTMAAILLGQIVRFSRDRRHPESLPLETVDVLARIVSGSVVEVVDRVLDDLLGS